MKRTFTHLLSTALLCSVFVAQSPAQVKDANGINDTTVDNYKKEQAVYDRYARPVPGSSRRGQNPVLFLIGNSTMRTGTKGNGNNGQWGWGAFAQQYFDSTRITVENHALGGTSSRTFYNQLWADVLPGIQPGDFVLIELGHNDNGPYDTFTARNSIPGIDPDTLLHVTLHDCRAKDWNGRQEVVYSYGQYLRMFIRDVRERGGNPMIASLTPRNSWDNATTITRKWNTFTPWGKAVAAEQNVPWIDLEGVSASRLEQFGHWKTDYMFYYVDKIHTSRFGAQNNAYSFALAVEQCPNCPLKDYLVNMQSEQAQVNRVSGRPVVWLCGDSTGKNEDKDPNGMWGWGSQAYTVFDSTRCTFANEAKAGRSCRTYLNEGRWDRVYNALQPGDIVLLQFGHNDVGDIEKGKARGEIAQGTDSTHVYLIEKTGEYEAVYSFGWYLKKMIQDAREKGAFPILVSLTPRNEWPDGKHIERRNDTYGRWYREVILATGVPFIDVHNITADHHDSIGRKKAAAYYNHDHTHTSLLGAQCNAQSIAIGMKALGYDQLISR